MKAPTKRQLSVLLCIAKSIARRGISPTYREIGDELDIRSTNGVNDHLEALERRGLVLRTGRGERQSARRIVLTDHGRALIGDIAPKQSLAVSALPHVVIAPSRCGQCGATTFAPGKACVICKVIAEEAA